MLPPEPPARPSRKGGLRVAPARGFLRIDDPGEVEVPDDEGGSQQHDRGHKLPTVGLARGPRARVRTAANASSRFRYATYSRLHRHEP